MTSYGESLAISYHLIKEGANVLVGMVDDMTTACEDEKEDPKVHTRRWEQYKGMMPILPADKWLKTLEKIENKDDWFIFIDFNNMYEYSEKLLAMGFTNGFFPTKLDHKLEEDSEFGKKFVEKNYP